MRFKLTKDLNPTFHSLIIPHCLIPFPMTLVPKLNQFFGKYPDEFFYLYTILSISLRNKLNFN